MAEFRKVRLRTASRPSNSPACSRNVCRIGRDQKKILNVIIKADVRGSLRPLSDPCRNWAPMRSKLTIGSGGRTETDAYLATTSRAMVIGFNTRADNWPETFWKMRSLQLRYYNVIYDVIDDTKAIMGGMLEPEIREEIVGIAEVRDVFNSPKFGQIAGSMVIEGTVYRSKPIRVLRDNVIYEGELISDDSRMTPTKCVMAWRR